MNLEYLLPYLLDFVNSIQIDGEIAYVDIKKESIKPERGDFGASFDSINCFYNCKEYECKKSSFYSG